jgi:hypothetical protein
MPYAIVRMQKFQGSGVKGIQIHDNRERPSRTNPDIDKDRRQENYSLVASENWTATVKSRLDTLQTTKAIRKDAVVMCQIMVTSDATFFKTLTPEKEKEFFQKSFDFIAERYGRDNIIAATVHKDEKTPHLHINFTPIHEGKLAANIIFDRKGLHSLHNEFHHNVGQAWGLQRGESREEKRRHQDVATFKRTTAEAELEKVQTELAKAKAQAAELEETKAELEKTKVELSAFKGVREGTAKALAQAQAWSIEKAQQAVLEKAAREQAKQPTISRGHGMRMGRGM